MFNPYRCYTYSSGKFRSPVVKANVNTQCHASEWDGNFLNWLTMRKVDLAKKVLIGGRTLSASNSDGTANTLLGEPKTGSDGSTARCKNTSSFCFRFVKQASGSGNRYPSTLPKDAGNVSYFGVGEGKVFVSAIATESDVFGASSSNKFAIEVDLTTETDAVRIAESTGLLQNLSTDNMRVAVMFTNADNGKAARVFRAFDADFDASAITGIRNKALSAVAALGEGTYEALCYFRNSQGACYNNSPPDFEASTEAQGDPYFFVSNNQMVSCCKSYILMVSSGQPTADGGVPDRATPFGNLFATDTIGLSSTWLDDVAYYGKTNDVRDQTSGATGYLTGTQDVTFYAVNAMGGAAGSNVLSSAAKYGGFEDQNSNNVPDSTGQTCTYPAGSTLGSGSSVSNLEWDLDQDCVPDTYFEASQGKELKAKIETAITDILKKAASGSSVSVLASSSSGEGALYQAFFFPTQFEGLNEINWLGYMQGLFLDSFGNIREDSDGDGKLVYKNDKIIQTRLDTTTNDVKVDLFDDANGDGKADSSTPSSTVGLKDVKGIWEGGKQLALKAASARTLLTWVDSDNNGVVASGEQIAFSTANASTLAPYLRAGAAPYTASNIIDFIRGEQVTGMRNRQVTVNGSLEVWKMGDPVHSTPVIVGAPQERYDVIYGDGSYTDYFLKYKDRRQVAYVGANDGMLHAFNAGFYHRGDDTTTTAIEHGWFTRTPTDNSGGAVLGDERWGFIPQELLPHLQWLADPNYTHVYYVDLKPKVTDARIFTADTAHPNGWGTILIGGFRMGGSCGTCTAGSGAPPMTVTADFGSGSETRTFYTAYFALDITDPEVDPKLLWVFSDSTLGLSTSRPVVLRVNPSSDGKTDNTNAKWLMVVGSGPTGYAGTSAQTAKLFAIDMKTGPKDTSGSNTFTTFPTSDASAFMGSPITLDSDLDYRVDASYGGNVISNSGTPAWIGRMYRLTTGDGSTNLATWGIDSSGSRVPTVLLASFPASATTNVGPIAAAPTVTLDDSSQIWLFFGTGRFFDNADMGNTDTQYFFGVKDPVPTGGCTESTLTNCEKQDLVDISNAVVCVVCSSGTTQVTGVTGVTSLEGDATTTLQGLIQSKDGWFMTLSTTGERVVASPTILGGTVFFPSFVPNNNVCLSAGDGVLYALFYLTGTGHTESSLGTEVDGSGNTNASRSVSIGSTGLASQMALHMGGQGTGGAGAASNAGCAGRVTGFIQSSAGRLTQFCSKPALSGWSRYVSWIGVRSI